MQAGLSAAVSSYDYRALSNSGNYEGAYLAGLELAGDNTSLLD